MEFQILVPLNMTLNLPWLVLVFEDSMIFYLPAWYCNGVLCLHINLKKSLLVLNPDY